MAETFGESSETNTTEGVPGTRNSTFELLGEILAEKIAEARADDWYFEVADDIDPGVLAEILDRDELYEFVSNQPGIGDREQEKIKVGIETHFFVGILASPTLGRLVKHIKFLERSAGGNEIWRYEFGKTELNAVLRYLLSKGAINGGHLDALMFDEQ